MGLVGLVVSMLLGACMSRDPVMDLDNPNEYRRESRAGKVFLALLALAVVVAAVPWFMKRSGIIIPKGPAPEITAAGWVNGEAPTKESLAGKVVVVCAWATWCGPCRAEAPHLVAVHKKFSDRGVVFIGLTTEGEENLDKIQGFLKKAGITWPNGWGAIETARALKADYIPALYVIDRDGQLVWFNQEDGGELEEVLETVLRQPSNRS